jgi:hypothetical protein
MAGGDDLATGWEMQDRHEQGGGDPAYNNTHA